MSRTGQWDPQDQRNGSWNPKVIIVKHAHVECTA